MHRHGSIGPNGIFGRRKRACRSPGAASSTSLLPTIPSGPSGCGKTTSLRMVAGLEQISAGAIRIGDRVVNQIAPKDRDIAMVFQNYALYPHMTVFENMAFGLRLRKMRRPEVKSRVEDTA